MGLGILFQGSNLERLLGGLWITAEIAFVSVFFACILGVILGVVMTSKNKAVHFFLPAIFRDSTHYPLVSITLFSLFWVC